jgi:hypothetical protein
METSNSNYLKSIKNIFRYYKSLGDKVLLQVDEEGMHWQYNEESNSLATLIKHISGNSLSRWTDFLTADGEKETRDRDDEFEDTISGKEDLVNLWNKGWECLFTAIDGLNDDDLMRTIYIRNEGHTVIEAVNRQLAHIPYHVGQMLFIAKMVTGSNWQTPTIAKGQSKSFNQVKFSAEKQNKFFSENK